MLSSLFYIGLIVHECIEIHLKACGGWIIVMEFRVLLIIHYLIREILVKGELDVHAKGVKIKSFLIQMLYRCIFYKKSSWRNLSVSMHTENHMYLTIP